jgi:hypothetical protein
MKNSSSKPSFVVPTEYILQSGGIYTGDIRIPFKYIGSIDEYDSQELNPLDLPFMAEIIQIAKSYGFSEIDSYDAEEGEQEGFVDFGLPEDTKNKIEQSKAFQAELNKKGMHAVYSDDSELDY